MFEPIPVYGSVVQFSLPQTHVAFSQHLVAHWVLAPNWKLLFQVVSFVLRLTTEILVVFDVEVDGAQVFEQLLVQLREIAVLIPVSVVVLELSHVSNGAFFLEIKSRVSFCFVINLLRNLFGDETNNTQLLVPSLRLPVVVHVPEIPV